MRKIIIQLLSNWHLLDNPLFSWPDRCNGFIRVFCLTLFRNLNLFASFSNDGLSFESLMPMFPLVSWICIWRWTEQIQTVFAAKACIEMREAAKSLTKRLAQTAQETFADFEEAVEKDATKTAVLDGTVHPLTSYVINYVKFLFE